MRKYNGIVLTSCLAILIGVLYAADTSQAGVPAFAGNAQRADEALCFDNSQGRVMHVTWPPCPPTPSRRWCVGLQNVGGNGQDGVDFGFCAMHPSGGSVRCHANVVNVAGTVVSGSGVVSLGSGEADNDRFVWMGYHSVLPEFGSAYICCDLSVGARLNTVQMERHLFDFE
jgi:hypothetical protein